MNDHDELRVSLGSFVLGNLDLDDRERVEEHLRTCEHCRAELELLRPLTGLLGLARATAVDPVEASPLLEQRVLDDRRRAVGVDRHPTGRRAARDPRRWGSDRRRLVVASAGALLGVLGTVGIMAAAGAFDGASPATTTVALRPVTAAGGPTASDAATARIVATGSGSRVALDASLPPTTGRQVYEVWFVSPRGRVSAGTFRVGPAGRATAELGVAAGRGGFGKIGITREPDADDPTRNGETVVSGALPD